MNEVIIILMIPVVWYFVSIGYHLFKLFRLWLEYKLENVKELRLWD